MNTPTLISLIFGITLSTTAAWADENDEFPYVKDATDICLAKAQTDAARQDCAFESAGICMTENVYGESNAGMAGCLGKGLEDWDERLNDIYQALLKVEKNADVIDGELIYEEIQKAPALQEMQRAWIGYRDAACHYSSTQYSGGSGSRSDMVACLLNETARQTIRLQSYLNGKN